MANTLGNYNPLFYAQEALIQLESQLGMASRVHRGYDDERRAFGKGDTISIRKPGTFTVNNAPATAEDLAPETSSIVLDQWKEVKFKLSDKELAYTQQRIIEEHISPAMYAMANHVDGVLCGLYTDVGNGIEVNDAGDKALTNIASARKVQRDLGVPMDGNLNMMIDTTLENAFLIDSAFVQHQGAGATGVDQQKSGSIGNKLGYDIFSSQNVKAHTGGGNAKGATSMTIDSGTDADTFNAGDTFTITGDSQKYSVKTTVTTGSGAGTVVISPPMQQANLDDAVVTFDATVDYSGVGMAFHKNAFALALAPLPDQLPNNMGAQVATVSDPRTGLAIRSRMYYVGNSSEVHVAFDVLYGVKTLDPNLACRLNR